MDLQIHNLNPFFPVSLCQQNVRLFLPPSPNVIVADVLDERPLNNLTGNSKDSGNILVVYNAMVCVNLTQLSHNLLNVLMFFAI